MTSDPTWSDSRIAGLRTLWAQGLSTAKIGQRLGLGKNAVIGKARRLRLPPRPSPIHHALARPSPIRHALARGERTPIPVLAPPRTALAEPVRPVPAAPAPSPPAASTPVLRAPPVLHAPLACCWPIGDPGRPGFRFCEAAAAASKPYCPAHAEAAYVSPKRAKTRRDGRALDRFLARLPPQP